MSEKGFRVEIPVNINRRPPKASRRQLPRDNERDDVPRIARLLALAHKWEGMVRRGEVKSYSQIAHERLLSGARVTQICELALLSPEIQNSILTGSARVETQSPRTFRRLARKHLWASQKRGMLM